MPKPKPQPENLTPSLNNYLFSAAMQASQALAIWLGTEAELIVDGVIQCPLAEALAKLGDVDQEIAICVMAFRGTISGVTVLAFDDTSGWKLADLLLQRPSSATTVWGDLEISAAMESMNIIGCAYLNGLAKHLAQNSGCEISLNPEPPEFCRDYAAAIGESLFVDQYSQESTVFYISTRFLVAKQAVHWGFLVIPDTCSRSMLLTLSEKTPEQ